MLETFHTCSGCRGTQTNSCSVTDTRDIVSLEAPVISYTVSRFAPENKLHVRLWLGQIIQRNPCSMRGYSFQSYKTDCLVLPPVEKRIGTHCLLLDFSLPLAFFRARKVAIACFVTAVMFCKTNPTE